MQRRGLAWQVQYPQGRLELGPGPNLLSARSISPIGKPEVFHLIESGTPELYRTISCT